jgi:hypothetical protein
MTAYGRSTSLGSRHRVCADSKSDGELNEGTELHVADSTEEAPAGQARLRMNRPRSPIAALLAGSSLNPPELLQRLIVGAFGVAICRKFVK